MSGSLAGIKQVCISNGGDILGRLSVDIECSYTNGMQQLFHVQAVAHRPVHTFASEYQNIENISIE